MPIYLYECDSCGLRFEKMQRMTEEPLTDCPECDGQVRRIIQPVGIIFKGSGFYVTDNRQGSSPTLVPPKDREKDKEAAKDKETAKAPVETKSATEGSSKDTKASE
jgi:putative FmdB family regulatory protein